MADNTLKNNKVLIVDDAALMRRMLSDILNGKGFKVIGEAHDGDIGVQMYKDLKPDLVTMDIVMDRMNGLEALKLIKEYDKDANVVIISAVDERKRLLEAIKLGASDFIVKPFDKNRVVSAAKKAVENR